MFRYILIGGTLLECCKQNHVSDECIGLCGISDSEHALNPEDFTSFGACSRYIENIKACREIGNA